jgi:2-hydroxy-6-oxonona-2,4-dienedioate hydrolase
MARPFDSSRLAAAGEPRVPAGSQLTSRRLEVLGVRIHARTGGEGTPVVLLHGYGVSGTYMLPLARLLAPSFSVFVPDLPGFGRSEQPPTPLGIADLASMLADLLDAAELQCPAFVANSMGCQVVTELAVRRPGGVGPIVLVGPTVDPQRRTTRRQLLDALRDAAREPGPLLARAACDDVRFGVAALLATARSALADRIEERLPLITQPALVVRGENDGFVGQAWAETAAALLPRGQLVVVPRQPHAVHYTRPDLVARMIEALVAEEVEQVGSQLPWRFPHRYVPAVEAHEPGTRQDRLPFRRDSRGKQPIVLAPNE